MGRKPMPPKAPYIPKGWLQNFLQLIKRVRLTKIDRGIVKQYNLTAEGNESKLVAALRFLKLADDEGNIDDTKITSLKMEGDNFKTAFDKLIHEAYAEVFQSLNIEKATSTDLKNFFTGSYGYSQIQSTGAAVLFVFLADLAGIPISAELLELNKQGVRFRSERKERNESKTPKKVTNRETIASSSQIHHILPGSSVNEDEYLIILRGKDFSLNKTIRNAEDLELVINTIKLNCQFKKKDDSH